MLVATCPSREELVDYAVGKLSDEDADALAAHLDGCPSCQAELAALPEADDSLVGRLRERLLVRSVPGRIGLASAVAQAKAAGTVPIFVSAKMGLSPCRLPNLPAAVGRVSVLERLGSGGMGTVYKARHTKLGRVVAVKVLTRGRAHDRAAVARFEHEMQAVGLLDHRQSSVPTTRGRSTARRSSSWSILLGWTSAKSSADWGRFPICQADWKSALRHSRPRCLRACPAGGHRAANHPRTRTRASRHQAIEPDVDCRRRGQDSRSRPGAIARGLSRFLYQQKWRRD